MAFGLIDKLASFLTTVEEQTPDPEPQVGPVSRRAPLRVHIPGALKVFIATPVSFDDVQLCADYLKANVAVLINYENVDSPTQQRMCDFLVGVSCVTGGGDQRVSDTIVLYVPANIEVSKELYAYSIPTYVKQKKDGHYEHK